MMKTAQEIRDMLFAMQDAEYRAFQSALMPTVAKETVIGVRIPEIRKLAKSLAREGSACQFLQSLPHDYYEENNLHAFLIGQLADFEGTVAELERFLPYVDNWATCDSIAPKAFLKNPDLLLPKIEEWLSSDHPYTVRFASGLLMRHFLNERFSEIYPARIAKIRSDEYYVNMMIAWYFATALAKQYDAVIPYITEHRLSTWIHNKTIQKAVESCRITDAKKQFLRTLRVTR